MSLVKNSILYLVSTILIKATTFFLLPFYSYLVTPEEYGYVYVVSAASTFLMFLMLLSIHACISRFLFDCNNEDDVKKLYSTVVYILGGNASIIALVLLILDNVIANFINIPTLYFRLTIIISYLGAFYNVILALLYARQEAKKVSLTLSVVGILNIIVQLLLVLNMQNKALALILAMVINSILTFLIFLWFSKSFIAFVFDKSMVRKYIYYSLSQFPSDVSAWVAKFTDRVIINKYIGPAETGVYGVGTTVGMIPQVIFQSMNQAYVPHIYSKYKKIEKGDNSGVNEVINITTVICSFIIMLITILVIFSKDIINLFSEAYYSAFVVVVIMLLASLFENFRSIFMLPMCYNIKYTKIKSLIWVIAGALNFVVNIFIIPKYGIIGACFTALFTYFLTFVALWFFSNKAMPIKYEWGKIGSIFIISVVASLTIFLGAQWWDFILKVIVSVIYSFICILMIKPELILNPYNSVRNHFKQV